MHSTEGLHTLLIEGPDEQLLMVHFHTLQCWGGGKVDSPTE
jgi:hypothetical protein